MLKTPRWLTDITRSRYLRTALVAGAFAASHATSRADIMLDTYFVTADRIYDDYTVVISNYWDGDSWEVDFDVYWDSNVPPEAEGGPLALDPEDVKYVGELYMPGDPYGAILRHVWESLPVRLGNLLAVTREYQLAYTRTLYIGGDGHYYYFGWNETDGFHWQEEQTDGSWLYSANGPPAVFAD